MLAALAPIGGPTAARQGTNFTVPPQVAALLHTLVRVAPVALMCASRRRCDWAVAYRKLEAIAHAASPRRCSA